MLFSMGLSNGGLREIRAGDRLTEHTKYGMVLQ